MEAKIGKGNNKKGGQQLTGAAGVPHFVVNNFKERSTTLMHGNILCSKIALMYCD